MGKGAAGISMGNGPRVFGKTENKFNDFISSFTYHQLLKSISNARMSFSINSSKPWSHPRVHSLEFSSKVRSFRQTKTFQKSKLPKYRASLDLTQHSSLVSIKEEPKYSLFRVKTYG